MNKFTAGVLLATLCVAFTANAARPSFTSLQQQINVLNARINELEAYPKPYVVFNANGEMLGRSYYNDPTPAISVLFSTREGYSVSVNQLDGSVSSALPLEPDTSKVSERFYGTTDCSGPELVGYFNYPDRGEVGEGRINNERTGDLWYYPAELEEPQRTLIQTARYPDQTECVEWMHPDLVDYVYH